jgi:hypothetical protein
MRLLGSSVILSSQINSAARQNRDSIIQQRAPSGP